MVYISFMGGKPLINGRLKFVQFKTQIFWFKINILARYRQHCGKEIKSQHRTRSLLAFVAQRILLLRSLQPSSQNNEKSESKKKSQLPLTLPH